MLKINLNLLEKHNTVHILIYGNFVNNTAEFLRQINLIGL